MVKQIGHIEFEPSPAASASNDSMFLDSTTNNIQFKNNAGSSQTINVMEFIDGDILAGAGTTLSVTGLDLTPYQQIILVIDGYKDDNDNADNYVHLAFNDDAGANYYYTYLANANVSTATATTGLRIGYLTNTETAMGGSHWRLNLRNVAGAITSLHGTGKGDSSKVFVCGGSWDVNALITKIAVIMTGANFSIGSRLSIYGVR